MYDSKDRWYNIGKKEDAAQAMYDYCRSIEDMQTELHERNLFHARLYANKDMLGLDWQSNTVRDTASSHRWTSENVTQSAVDTAQALIAKQRPRCAVSSTGGDYKTQQQAKKLDSFLYADMKYSGVYSKAPLAFRDGEIFGTGLIKVIADKKSSKVRHERVCPDELIVDERECISDPTPTQMFHRRCVAASTVQAMFDLDDKQMAKAQSDLGSNWTKVRNVPKGMVVIVEGWRRAPCSGAKGRHIIALPGLCLLDEEYKYEDFPFAEFRWRDPLAGYYGDGLVESGAGIQLRINKLNRHIDRCLELMASPKYLVPAGSRLKPSDFTNAIGDILVYTGQMKPDIWVGRSVGPEVFDRLATLAARYYELAGVSTLSASSKKPAGLESGAALREYNDRETDRFAVISQKYEDFFLRIGELHIRAAREIGGSRSVVVGDKNLQRTMKWSEVDIDDDRFELSIEAASILSKTPAGRKSDVMDMINVGFITPDQAPSLLGNPDIDRWRDLETADRQDAEATVEALLEGEAVVPDEMQNLQLCAAVVQRELLNARRMGYPKKITKNMLGYVERARDMMEELRQAEMNMVMEQQMMQAQAAAPAPQPAPPQTEG